MASGLSEPLSYREFVVGRARPYTRFACYTCPVYCYSMYCFLELNRNQPLSSQAFHETSQLTDLVQRTRFGEGSTEPQRADQLLNSRKKIHVEI